MERYKMHIDGSNLPAAMKETLKARDPCTLDELDEAYSELIHFLQYADYYDAIDRYERGQSMLEQEQDAGKQARYRKRLNELAAEIERLTPKGETA